MVGAMYTHLPRANGLTSMWIIASSNNAVFPLPVGAVSIRDEGETGYVVVTTLTVLNTLTAHNLAESSRMRGYR